MMSANSYMVAKEVKTEMQEDMLEYAVETTRRAFDKYTTESEVAQFIKKEFDNQYNPTWHCIVGKTYGRQVIVLYLLLLAHWFYSAKAFH